MLTLNVKCIEYSTDLILQINIITIFQKLTKAKQGMFVFTFFGDNLKHLSPVYEQGQRKDGRNTFTRTATLAFSVYFVTSNEFGRKPVYRWLLVLVLRLVV